ncbi:MAG: restriction endonuclease subunit S [Brasilonema angustatum HA4187-MV1]|jgi:type I restriction enzyme S subunit|nr:restriction endonuclease subunit S [Brasilonema angustatum HA4187-MV1]
MNFAPVKNIPKDWNIVELQTTGEVIYGIQASVANNTKPIGTKIITNKNLSIDGKLIFEKQSYFEIKTASHRRTLLKKGDILFNWRSGSQDHVGKTAYFDIDGEYIHSSFILRIRPNTSIINGKFLYYYLYWLRESKYFIKVHSYAINAKFNKSAVNSLPTILPILEEQRKMAVVLSMVQDAIAQQEQLITLTTELKKALMQKLFAEGTRGEPQKMTEIGLIPESWDLVPCSELCKTITVGVVVKPASYYVESGIPAFRSLNVREDQLVTENLVYFSPEDNDGKLAKSKVYAGDVLIVRTGYPGTSCVVPEQYEGSNCIDIVIARPKNTISSKFLSRFFNSPAGKLQAFSAKHGLAQQHLNVGAVKNVLVPIPPSLDEQNGIGIILETIDNKLNFYKYKKSLFADIFRTLIHQLMTAQIRVDDLKISALNLELQGGDE